MKFFLSLLAILFAVKNSYAQETLQTVSARGNTANTNIVINSGPILPATVGNSTGSVNLLSSTTGPSLSIGIVETENTSTHWGWLQTAYANSAGVYGKLSLNPLGGNVGIGTTSPDQKLTVNGTIHSKEVKVDTSIPVPDYVFDADYKSPTLIEIKDYIAKNHHLPGIPSAEQIEKDGLNLGEMNLLLLKKVEELTLHLIEKNEEIGELKKQKNINQSQQIQIDQLQHQLEVIIKEIHKN